ncbi:thermonuclease family protein [Fulvivirga sediminis]|uniref:Thermonuclease family protein n=1 Tax=Fulvivirga sediminis TaxID=2803949 RepID=A0A937JXR0_9BACT|nr:thermonuclease family protein [Fulvivirga sediminis]MBL3654879.1 thermonuclease family protein [Fulvivirga sediminis]
MRPLLLFFLLVNVPNLFAEEFSGKVINVIDGNTLEVLSEDNETIKVLLSEVDCPEEGQRFSEEARRFTMKLALKKKVTVELKGKDRWGNKLAVVVLKNGVNLNNELVSKGLAWAYKAEERLVALEQNARDQKVGLWSESEVEAPWIYRRKQTMLAPKGR